MLEDEMSSFQSPVRITCSPDWIHLLSIKPKSSQNVLVGSFCSPDKCWEYTVDGPRPEPDGLYAETTLVLRPFAPFMMTQDHLPNFDSSDPESHVSAILSLAIITVPPG